MEIQKLQPGINVYEQLSKELQDYNKSFRSSDYEVAAPEEFQFKQTTEDFLNPYIDYRIKKTGEAIDRSAANRGTLFSGGTAKELLEKTSEITDTDWERATARRSDERRFEYDKQRQRYADIVANANRNLDLWETKGGLLATNVDAQGNVITQQGKVS